MRTLHRDVSAISRRLGIRRADLGGIRSGCGDIQLYLTSGGVPVAPLTLPADHLPGGLGVDCILVRDYGEHRGLARVLEAAGIAHVLTHTVAGGCPVVVMHLAACLLAKIPAARAEREAAA